jgi:hypothetical protein
VDTTWVVNGNSIVSRPAATVTADGTLTAASLVESETAVPPDGAGKVRRIVPRPLFPPSMARGDTVTEDNVLVFDGGGEGAGRTVDGCVGVTLCWSGG